MIQFGAKEEDADRYSLSGQKLESSFIEGHFESRDGRPSAVLSPIAAERE